MPLVHSRCSSFNLVSICGFSPGLWNSDKNPSRKMFVGMRGDVELEASDDDDTGAGLASFLGFEVDAVTSARAFAAASFVPNSSVKIASRELLISLGFAHLQEHSEQIQVWEVVSNESETISSPQIRSTVLDSSKQRTQTCPAFG